MNARTFRRVVATVFCFCLVTVAPAGVNTWTTSGPPVPSVYALAVDPDRPSVIYSSAFIGTVPPSGGVYMSGDGGASWGVRALAEQFVTALAAGPSGTVYAGTDSGLVFKSTDRGATWIQIALAAPVDFIKIDPLNPMILYRRTSDRVSPGGLPPFNELLRSSDGGANWASIQTGLGFFSLPHLGLDPQRSGTLYAVTLSAFYKSTDFGTSWSAIPNGLSSRTVTTLVVDPFTPATLYAGTFGDVYAGTFGGVSKSTDGGATFTSASNGLANVRVTDLVADPAHRSRLYVGTLGNGVFSSVNGGASWTPMNLGLTNLNVRNLVIDPTGTFLHAGTQGGGVFDFQLDPSAAPCSAGPTALCLNGGRFRVEVGWRVPSQGTSGLGQARPMTSDTGAFWFFTDSNIELAAR